ncbi:hypothetical protein H1D32_08440 [Anaerobacillus sp. CMMVII]|nr:hypothetical protein [Anaerobacillus sp. CMMVII]MCT8137781.1 hypothetical protein [Anaerobacillus sp. CMMVII]
MEGKPNHYDGSIQHNNDAENHLTEEPFQLTDEMRANLSGNPYTGEKAE